MSEIRSAALDGQEMPAAEIPRLYWDLQRQRVLDAPSKCVGFAEFYRRFGPEVP